MYQDPVSVQSHDIADNKLQIAVVSVGMFCTQCATSWYCRANLTNGVLTQSLQLGSFCTDRGELLIGKLAVTGHV